MNQVIVYPQNNGRIAIVYPAAESGLSVNEIARKDVPAGKPYILLNTEDIPTDFVFFDAWEADFSNADGEGIGHKAWFIEQYQTKIDDLNAQTYPVMEVGQDALEYADGLNQWQLNKAFRIAELNAMIAIQQMEMQA